MEGHDASGTTTSGKTTRANVSVLPVSSGRSCELLREGPSTKTRCFVVRQVPRGRRLVAKRVAEEEGLRKVRRAEEIEARLVLGLCLAAKSGNHVGRDGDAGDALTDVRDEVVVRLSAISPIHPREDPRIAVLGRHVDLLADVVVFPDGLQHVVAEVLRMRTRVAHAHLGPGRLGDPVEEFGLANERVSE
jgi:hypothetical protein